MEDTAYSKLVTDLVDLETDTGLLDTQFRELKIYQHLRMPIFYYLAADAGLFRARKLAPRWRRIGDHFRSLGRVLKQNEYWGVAPTEILAVSSGREIPVGDTVSEICLHYLLPELRGVCTPVFLADGDDMGAGRNLAFHSFNLRARVEDRLHGICRRVGLQSRLHDEATVAANTIASVLAPLSAEPDALAAFLVRRILLEYFLWKAAQRLLDRTRPKLLIVVAAYQHANFVVAAKRRGVPVVELQHGVIHARHQGYNYPYVPSGGVEVFPDYLLTFGDYWKDATAFPVSVERRLAVGFPHFEAESQRVRTAIDRSKKRLLFISQSTIGSAMLEVAKEVAGRCPGYEVLFKLHPKEIASGAGMARNETDRLPDNLKIMDSGSPPLYQLIASSSWQVGVFSTVIYEGLGMGLKTIVVQLPGWENMRRLIDSGAVSLARDASMIVETLAADTSPAGSGLAEEFFRPNAVSNIVGEIQRIRATHESERPADRTDLERSSVYGAA